MEKHNQHVVEWLAQVNAEQLQYFLFISGREGKTNMTREEITKEYKVDENGLIRSPGKFECQMIYVPYFWDAFLNGCADRDDGDVLGFNVTSEDKAIFPELEHRRTVKLYEDDNGFVVEV